MVDTATQTSLIKRFHEWTTWMEVSLVICRRRPLFGFGSTVLLGTLTPPLVALLLLLLLLLLRGSCSEKLSASLHRT